MRHALIFKIKSRLGGAVASPDSASPSSIVLASVALSQALNYPCLLSVQLFKLAFQKTQFASSQGTNH